MQTHRPNVIDFPIRRRPAQADEGLTAVIRTLEAQLTLAREGKLRSIALASVSADGAAVQTNCSCRGEDAASLAEFLSDLGREMKRSARL